MAPNRWDSSARILHRPLRLSDSSTSVDVAISYSSIQHSLLLRIYGIDIRNISTEDQAAIERQVKRMLRISEKEESIVIDFQNMHPKAKQRNFGRLFRSPSLFEDLIKALLLWNCQWTRTLEMAKALCELDSRIRNQRKRKYRTDNIVDKSLEESSSSFHPIIENFPRAEDLACLDENILNKYCNLGYRAKYILDLAKLVQSGKLQLDKVEQNLDKETYETFWKKFARIKGFGPFACTNALMCLGFYNKIPADSETIRHMKEVNGKRNCNKKTLKYDLEDIYGSYGKFQCLAYWFELLEGYEKKVGKMCDLPTSKYYLATGSLVDECETNE